MQNSLADCLLLVFPETLPLSAWQRADSLTRDWEVFRRLRGSYQRVVVATPGGEEDRAALATVDRTPTPFIFGVTPKTPPSASAIREAVGDSASVVVRTIQVCGCDTAIPITGTLRAEGRSAALLARSGFLWSKFAALEAGPHSPQALRVARREGDLCRGADSVMGVTQRMVDDLAWRHGLDPVHCSVVPNYVLTDHPAMKSEGREQNTVLTTGPLVKRRRIHLIIEAIAAIAETGATLTILGEGPEEAPLRALADTLKAPVTFVRPTTYADRLHRMSTCAVYVCASQLEGHPKGVLEALACGTAVIVPDAQGVGSVVHHGVTGLRISAEVDAFSHAMRDMLADQEWREVLGASASRTTLTTYGIGAVLEAELAAHRMTLRIAAAAPEEKLSA